MAGSPSEPSPASASAAERREAILDLLLEHESVAIRQLVERFGVSTMTVHRDLDALERRGVLRKVRGGATAQPTALYESSLGYRLSESRDAKDRIARVAAMKVEPGSSVLLDDSTTALAMLPYLAEIEQLTIATNFVSVVEEVAKLPDSTLTLLVVGGTYSSKYHAFGGVLAETALRDLRIDRCFVAVSSIDVRRGAFHQEADQAVIKRVMIEVSDEPVLLADASKFSKRALHRVVSLEAFSAAVVDDGTSTTDIEGLRVLGVDVEVASSSTAPARQDGEVVT